MSKHQRQTEKLHKKLAILKGNLNKPFENADEARKTAAVIFDLLDKTIIDSDEADRLFESCREAIGKQEIEQDLVEILESQMQYALRLSIYDGILIWEEVFKLCSLCSEVYSLKMIGIPFNNETDIKLKLALEEQYKSDSTFRQEIHKSKLLSNSSWAVK